MPTFFAGQTDYIEKLNDVDAAAGAAQDDIDAHIADTTAAHAASAISNTPAGNVSATTVQAAINELDTEKLSASATALPSSFASASINSITPSGGTLLVGSASFAQVTDGVYNGYLGKSSALVSGGAGSDAALRADANLVLAAGGANTIVTVSTTGASVTGSISARNSTGEILAEDSRAVAVGIGGRLNMRARDDNGNYQNYGSIASWLTDGTPGAYAADTVLYTSLGGALAERVRLFAAGGASLTGLLDLSNAASGQIKFPATQNPSADANTLDDYQEATYTGTATGMTTSPTGTVSYTLTGNEATLNLPEITGTSNATTFTVTGMPAEARPASRKTVLGRAQDNGGAIVPVRIDIETTGVLTIYANADAGAFTSSGTKTLAECSVTYTRV